MFYQKLFFILIPILTFSSCSAQQEKEPSLFTLQNFDEKILSYSPPKRPGVEEKDYQRGLTILEETRSNTQNDPANLNEGDYWNIGVAFLKLKEPKEHLEIVFKKGTENPETFCSYIKAFGEPVFKKELPELFASFYEKCQHVPENEKPENPQSDKLNADLVKQMISIGEKDRRYRKNKTVDWEKQKLLDKENQQTIEALYQQHNTYIGRSLVGTEHEVVMWAVIQHADPEMMKKYLPVIHKAVQDGELHMGPLKMLLDRYYGLTKGYQFFGTQSGFGFENASKEEKNKIKEMYGID
jgi:hypothetical protein